MNASQFWSQFLSILEKNTGSKSNPNYYIPGSGGINGATAQEGEWANIIKVTFERTAPGSEDRGKLVDLLSQAGFWAPNDNLNWWKNEATLNDLDIQDLRKAAELRFPNMFDAQGNPTNVGMGAATGSNPGAAQPVGQVTSGGATTVPGIMQGGVLTKITRSGGLGDLWAMTYTADGIQHVYTFDSHSQMLQILGNDAITSGKYGFMTLNENQVDDGDTWILGSAAAFAGQTGTYGGWWGNIKQEAALEAGIRNPGMIGRYLADPEVQRIMAEAAAGGWSPERQQAELRRTNFYNNTLYPGIKAYLDQGVANPEGAWWQYHSNVEEGLRMMGYEPDADGTFRSKVGDMLGGRIDDRKFINYVPTYLRAKENINFGNVLGQWYNQDTGQNLNFDNWFDVLAGTTTPELDAIVEKATIQYQADQTSLGSLSAQQITQLAARTQFSEAQIISALTGAEKNLLAIGQQGLSRYGLTQEAIVNSAFGLASGDTADAMSAEQVQRLAQKTATELGLQDDAKAQFYVGFDQYKRPVREGLQAARPEVG